MTQLYQIVRDSGPKTSRGLGRWLNGFLGLRLENGDRVAGIQCLTVWEDPPLFYGLAVLWVRREQGLPEGEVEEW